jgi:hypothetical protein
MLRATKKKKKICHIYSVMWREGDSNINKETEIVAAF